MPFSHLLHNKALLFSADFFSSTQRHRKPVQPSFKKSLTEFMALALLLLVLTLLAACGDTNGPDRVRDKQLGGTAESLVIYSSRKEHLIKPVFDLYTQQTGVEIEYTTDKAGVLIERLKAEGANTPADLLITVDAGNLGYAASQGLFQSLDSDVVNRRVAPHLRDDNDLWTGLSLRARTLVYSTARVKPAQLSSYAALGEEQWRGKLCLRTAKKVYNQSLVSMLIAERGEQQSQTLVESWVANFAIPPTSNDTKLMEAILAGQCDVGIVNSYYFGRLQNQHPELALALFWPNQNDTSTSSGVHVNIAGIGLLKHAPREKSARAFVEWLVGDQAQRMFADVNQEYPVNPNVAVSAQVKSWGDFKSSQLPLSRAYELQPAAVKLMDRAGYH
jgi:iron(III) transport system substrate-binding protein